MAETVIMPKLGFDMAEGTLVRWVKSEGEAINKGDVIAEIETDKATVEVQSNFSGVVIRHLVNEKAIVPVNTPIAVVAAPGEKIDASVLPADSPTKSSAGKEIGETTPPPSKASPEIIPVDAGMLKASPLARKMAADRGIDLHSVVGTGPAGRIVKRDVESALAAPVIKSPEAAPGIALAAAPKAAPTVATVPMPVLGSFQATADQHIPLERLRQAIGRRMVESKQQVPHFYVTRDYDVAELMRLRKEANELLPEDQKLSVNDFIIKASALALRQFPNINASLSGAEIIRHGHVNVGVAVAVPGGLLTIVSKDTDVKPLRALSSEIKEMVARARSGKVRPDDIDGSTFSISNLGMYDVEEFIAIINPPEAAILAVGAVRQIPVVLGDEIKIGTRMKATLSADHRVTDGAEGAQFMQALAQYLEHPLRLLV